MQVFSSPAQIAEAIGVSSSHLAHLLIDARLIYAPPETRYNFTALWQPPTHRINAVFYEAFTRISLVLFILSLSLKPFSFSSKRNLSDSPTRAFTIQFALFIGVERYANRVPFLFIY